MKSRPPTAISGIRCPLLIHYHAYLSPVAVMSPDLTTITSHLDEVRHRIAAAALAFQRAPAAVTLLAVSKGQPAMAIRAAYAAGQTRFGESYAQEALPKMHSLADLPLEWHFIGQVQSNKTRSIAEHFDWVHSVDRMKIAQRLNDQRPPSRPPLNVCIEVQLSNEPGKGGVTPEDVPGLAQAIATLPRLRLRGLAAIPEPSDDHERQRSMFGRLHHLSEVLLAEHIVMDTLSMGMSGDFEAAIAEGATIVRIGTAIFGARPSA